MCFLSADLRLPPVKTVVQQGHWIVGLLGFLGQDSKCRFLFFALVPQSQTHPGVSRLIRHLCLSPPILDDDGRLAREDVDIAGDTVWLDEEDWSSEGDIGRGIEEGRMVKESIEGRFS